MNKVQPKTLTWPFILLFSALVYSTLAYPNPVFNGRELYDLTASSAVFPLEAADWTAVDLYGSQKVTVCSDGTPMLGGPGILRPGGYFQKHISNLPSHDVINFRIQLFLIDNWQGTDTVTIQFDDKAFSAGDIALSVQNFPSNFCGDSSYPDLDSFYIVGRVAHSASDVTIKIISQIGRPADIASFGIGTVNAVFSDTSSTSEDPPQDTSCAVADITLLSANKCACPSGQYQNPNNPSQCKSCNNACADCFGSSPSQCYGCTTDYSYVDTKCQKCHNSCSSCSAAGPSNCLSCPSSSWYQSDSTCTSTCSSPSYAQEVIGDVKVCYATCQSQEFYFWNNTCGTACPSPLVTEIDSGDQLCKLPCQSDQYLYWNNSCLATCPSPLIQSDFQSIVLQCEKPCQDSEFYYPNGTCQTTCDSPLRIKVENDLQYCISPCDDPSLYYSEDNSTCISECDTPNIIQAEPLFQKCITVNETSQGNSNASNNTQASNSTNSTQENSNPPNTSNTSNSSQEGSSTSNVSNTSNNLVVLTTEEVAQIRAVGSVLDAGGQTLTATMTVSSVIGAANPATSTLAGFVKMLPYIRYMKIDYPPKLQLMLDNMNSSLISFALGPSISPETTAEFTNYPVPSEFQDYQLHSSFIVNFYQTLTSLAILLGIIIVISVLVSMTKKKPDLHYILKGILLMMKWNFFLMAFCSNLDGIILGTSLQIRNIHFDSFNSVLSLLVCLLMNIILVYVLYLAYHIIKDIRSVKYVIHPIISGSSPQTTKQQKWKDFQLFFKGSKDDKFTQHIFMVIYLLRACLFNLVIAYMFEYPLAQAILITFLSVSMLIYMIWQRPFVSKVVHIQHCSDEIVMLIVNICMLSLAVMDHLENNEENTRITLGNIIIYSNIVFNITANIYLVVYLFQGFKSAYHNTKTHKNKGLVSWLTALLAPFESGGMDVEIVPIKDEKSPSLLLSPSNQRSSFHVSTIAEVDSRRPSVQLIPATELHVSCNSSIRDSHEISSSMLLLQDRRGSAPPSPKSELLSSPRIESPSYFKRSSKKRLSHFAPTTKSPELVSQHLNSPSSDEFILDDPLPPKTLIARRQRPSRMIVPEETKTAGDVFKSNGQLLKSERASFTE